MPWSDPSCIRLRSYGYWFLIQLSATEAGSQPTIAHGIMGWPMARVGFLAQSVWVPKVTMKLWVAGCVKILESLESQEALRARVI